MSDVTGTSLVQDYSRSKLLNLVVTGVCFTCGTPLAEYPRNLRICLRLKIKLPKRYCIHYKFSFLPTVQMRPSMPIVPGAYPPYLTELYVASNLLSYPRTSGGS